MIEELIRRFRAFGGREAIVCGGRVWSYGALADVAEGGMPSSIRPGSVVALVGQSSPMTISLLFALAANRCVVVPMVPGAPDLAERFEAACCDARVGVRGAEAFAESDARETHHPLLERLRASGHPGLVLFTSGSTGRPKAVLHDLALLLEKYRAPRPAMRTLSFMALDHIGGVNTILHVLASGGCLVVPPDRSVDGVLAAVERNRVEVFPATPTFLGLALIGGALGRHDLSSLRVVSYGTEVMPEATLGRLREALPGVDLRQTYGMSELGILRAKSRASGSLWVRVGGDGVETRVVDGMLEVRSQSAMLGYLNAPSPFAEDGWLRTEDEVEVDGPWIRFLGRRGDLINVGGEKVYPAEVEGALQAIENVAEASVRGEPNAIMGQVVAATVRLERPEDAAFASARIRRACRALLAPHKVPVRVAIAAGDLHGERWKKVR